MLESHNICAMFCTNDNLVFNARVNVYITGVQYGMHFDGVVMLVLAYGFRVYV